MRTSVWIALLPVLLAANRSAADGLQLPDPTFSFRDAVQTKPASDARRPAGPLRGRICIVSIFVTDDRTYWSDAEVQMIEPSITRGLALIRREATRYGVALEWVWMRADVAFDGIVSTDFEHNFWSSEVAVAAEPMRERCSQSGATAVVSLMHVNKVGRSYALPKSGSAIIYNRPIPVFDTAIRPEKNTGLVVVEGPDTIAHEVLHLFGARDLYQPEKVRRFADRHFPNDVMRQAAPFNQQRIRSPTAKAIGWR